MVFEPPCTERYARWCERTTAQIMSTLLLDCIYLMTSSGPGCPATVPKGALRRASMCQAFYQFFYIRERYIGSVSSNFLTQISCGIKTKCRKTRAMQRDFTIVDSLALRQCDTSMIPDTHSLKLLFLARYTPRSIRLVLWRALVYHRNI